MKCASVQRICQNLAARFAKPQSFRGLAQQKLVSLVVGGVQEAEWEGEDFLRARNQPQGGSAVRRPALGVSAQLGEGGSEEETSPGAPWAATAARSCRRPAGSLQDVASGLVNEPRRNFHTSLFRLESRGLLAVAPRMPSFACCLRPLVT